MCPLSVIVIVLLSCSLSSFHLLIFSRITWPISTKLGQKHLHVNSNKGPGHVLYQGEIQVIENKIGKVHSYWCLLQTTSSVNTKLKVFSGTSGSIWDKLCCADYAWSSEFFNELCLPVCELWSSFELSGRKTICLLYSSPIRFLHFPHSLAVWCYGYLSLSLHVIHRKSSKI